MESRQKTQSVMASLMGLDEVPQVPNRCPQKPQPVISETYRQRVASIGAKKKRLLYHERHSARKSLGVDKEICSPNVQSQSEKTLGVSQKSLERQGSSKFVVSRDLRGLQESPAHSRNAAASKAPPGSSVRRNVDVFRKSRRTSEFGYLNPLLNSVTASSRVVAREHEALDERISGGSKSPERYFSSGKSHRGDHNQSQFFSPFDRRVGVGQKERNSVSREAKSIPLRELSGRTRRMREIKGLSLGLSEKLSGVEAEKGLEISKPDVSRRRNHVRGLRDIDRRGLSKLQARYEAFRGKWYLKPSKPLNWERIYLVKQSSSKQDKDSSWPEFVNLKLETSNVSSPQQEASLGFVEERPAFSHCSRMELDSLDILDEAYQPSPISVLEPPFNEDGINVSEFLARVKDGIYDLGLQLELLRSESSETCSEGPGMAVSSDDECEEGSSCGVEEGNKDFTYLVEVITKTSLHGKSLEDFKTWYSLETPISLSVFETLEKKNYGQISSQRSVRRLLFDRVNKGLVEIFLPHFENPASRRFNTMRDNEMIKEALWRLLVAQEKKCGSEDNVFGSEFGKLELGEEIDGIGQEIERLLFDELLAELSQF